MLLSLLLVARATEELTLTLHGSGTTNPSKFIWRIHHEIESGAKLPIHGSYRAVGSSTGIAEYLAGTSDYALAEIALTVDESDALTADTGRVPLTLPVFIGSVSLFHSVPGVGELNLTGATAAGIFSGAITNWNDPAITADNPELSAELDAPIVVVHRVYGSSSTYLLSEYLNLTGGDAWTVRTSSDSPIGSTLEWPEGTVGAEGSGQVTATLQETPYAIGYLESGHGVSAGLPEVALRNADGNWLTSAKADVSAAAAVLTELPGPEDPWEEVSLVNQPGPDTWPMTAFTYLFLDKNQTRLEGGDVLYGTHRNSPDTGALAKAFGELIMSEHGQSLGADYGFTTLPENVLTRNAATLDALILADGTVEFKFETSTLKLEGNEERVISYKRKSALDVAIDQLETDIGAKDAQVAELALALAQATTELATLTERIATLEQVNPTPAPAVSGTATTGTTTTSQSDNTVAIIAIIVAFLAGLCSVGAVIMAGKAPRADTAGSTAMRSRYRKA